MGRLVIATHLDQSNTLSCQSETGKVRRCSSEFLLLDFTEYFINLKLGFCFWIKYHLKVARGKKIQ
jgi:hypothetical protein